MQRLTEQAQADRNSFERYYGSEGNCSCFSHPPCGSCTHPGNPSNQYDDSCWEEEKEEPEMYRASGSSICKDCGKEYRQHPMDTKIIGYGDEPFLNLLCDGRSVKL